MKKMLTDKLDYLPPISPRFRGSELKDQLISKGPGSPLGLLKSNGITIMDIETKFPSIAAISETLPSKLKSPRLAAMKRTLSAEIACDSTEEVDIFTSDDLLQKKGLIFVPGSPSDSTSFCSTESIGDGSTRSSQCRSIYAKADKRGYFIECSEAFLTISGLGDDFKSHSIISLVKFTTPEKLQQQAYMLDSLANLTLETGKGVKWTAELNNTYMDTLYAMHVTLSCPIGGSLDGSGGCELDIELKDIPSNARTSFMNNHSTGMLCRQSSFITSGGGTIKEPVVSSLRILVVDDSLIVLKLVSKLIEGEGHIVDCKKDGLEALEALKNTDYDAVLMDINMPEMGGLEASLEFRLHESLMHQYRKKCHSSKLKIIAMSGDFNEDSIEEVMRFGFDGFIAKPLTLDRFRELKLRPALVRNVSSRMISISSSIQT